MEIRESLLCHISELTEVSSSFVGKGYCTDRKTSLPGPKVRNLDGAAVVLPPLLEVLIQRVGIAILDNPAIQLLVCPTLFQNHSASLLVLGYVVECNGCCFPAVLKW